ncbi:glycosyltransferase family 4 protein [Pusillimonas sp. ANT_WB101]|uniref:glycosyltransferase family 4 protein n=1 Tax=Pusillimonas sp. ANT_WB101 TaxID=2597356 RepID=UPI0011F06B34|nr:glycosyltransferase family 4 protein [Pusillimonas sp. ANT_WB101]KAA0889513.1 glycosyltransferase family 4 protein [Pusillimonas sp. ANT_WB101]
MQQMLWEQQAAQDIGLSWQSRIMTNNSNFVSGEIFVGNSSKAPKNNVFSMGITWISIRIAYLRWLRAQTDVDVYVLRYSVHDPFQLFFIMLSRKPVYLVHHTMEIAELQSKGTLLGRLRAAADTLIGKQALRRAAGIVGVTQELCEYEKSRIPAVDKPTFVYPNGVRYQDNALLDTRGEIPELLFVANDFESWHGLDYLLDDLENTSRNFRLHLVGNVFPSDLGLCLADSRVIIHGLRSPEDIRDIAGRCWLGLTSFALFRKGMQEACTLKVREYLMLGLPVYSGHQDVFPAEYPHYRKGPAQLSAIVEYADSVRGTSRETVSASARPYIDKGIILSKLAKKLSI